MLAPGLTVHDFLACRLLRRVRSMFQFERVESLLRIGRMRVLDCLPLPGMLVLLARLIVRRTAVGMLLLLRRILSICFSLWTLCDCL